MWNDLAIIYIFNTYSISVQFRSILLSLFFFCLFVPFFQFFSFNRAVTIWIVVVGWLVFYAVCIFFLWMLFLWLGNRYRGTEYHNRERDRYPEVLQSDRHSERLYLPLKWKWNCALKNSHLVLAAEYLLNDTYLLFFSLLLFYIAQTGRYFSASACRSVALAPHFMSFCFRI